MLQNMLIYIGVIRSVTYCIYHKHLRIHYSFHGFGAHLQVCQCLLNYNREFLLFAVSELKFLDVCDKVQSKVM